MPYSQWQKSVQCGLYSLNESLDVFYRFCKLCGVYFVVFADVRRVLAESCQVRADLRGLRCLLSDQLDRDILRRHQLFDIRDKLVLCKLEDEVRVCELQDQFRENRFHFCLSSFTTLYTRGGSNTSSDFAM